MTANDIINGLSALSSKMNSSELAWLAMLSSRQTNGPAFSSREIAFMQKKLDAVTSR